MKNFPHVYEEIWKGSDEKSFINYGFLLGEEMNECLKLFIIYDFEHDPL
jgi:hypothetical protein